MCRATSDRSELHLARSPFPHLSIGSTGELDFVVPLFVAGGRRESPLSLARRHVRLPLPRTCVRCTACAFLPLSLITGDERFAHSPWTGFLASCTPTSVRRSASGRRPHHVCNREKQEPRTARPFVFLFAAPGPASKYYQVLLPPLLLLRCGPRPRQEEM
ncbi:hypothetical protein IWZ01DRAFT_71763 [Phyllosticta capitalensis]